MVGERTVEKRKEEDKRGGGEENRGEETRETSEERLLETPRAALWVTLKGEIKASPEY